MDGLCGINPISHLNKAVSEKQKNYIEDLNNSINHLDLTDICETPHNICTTFSSYVMRVGSICFLLGATIGLGNIYMTKTQSLVPQSWEFIAAVPQGRDLEYLWGYFWLLQRLQGAISIQWTETQDVGHSADHVILDTWRNIPYPMWFPNLLPDTHEVKTFLDIIWARN